MLDTWGKKATAASAIATLLAGVVYTSAMIWAFAHAQYATVSRVDYLYQKHIEVEIWRYEDELDTLIELSEILAKNAPKSNKLSKLKRRTEKIAQRLAGLAVELEKF